MSLEEVRQHHVMIKQHKTAADDQDYLSLFEAHQRRLDDAGAHATGGKYVLEMTDEGIRNDTFIH